MKKTFITYLAFILAMSVFITLRVKAGKVLAADTTEPKPVSENLTDTFEAKAPDEEPEEEPEEPDEYDYLWHGDTDPKAKFGGLIPRIVCWGDSLTVSLDEKSAFPDILRSLSGCEVINYGVEAENTSMIAMREGGLRVNVKATVIPADVTLIPIFLRTENNGHVHFLDNGDGGVNPCEIGGIEGELQKLNGSYYFKRSNKGERTAIEEGTQFMTHAMLDANPDDVLVKATVFQSLISCG